MRAARLVACTAAVAAFAIAPAATGAGRVCNLVVDAKDDQRLRPAPDGVYESPDLEIVGGDVASNKRYVTAVIRLASLRPVDTNVPTGRGYVVRFRVGAVDYHMEAQLGVNGESSHVWDDSKGIGVGRAAVVWDYQNRQVRITAPVRHFGLTPGAKIKAISMESQYFFGVGAVSGPMFWMGGAGTETTADTAETEREYRHNTPSCVDVMR